MPGIIRDIHYHIIGDDMDIWVWMTDLINSYFFLSIGQQLPSFSMSMHFSYSWHYVIPLSQKKKNFQWHHPSGHLQTFFIAETGALRIRQHPWKLRQITAVAAVSKATKEGTPMVPPSHIFILLQVSQVLKPPHLVASQEISWVSGYLLKLLLLLDIPARQYSLSAIPCTHLSPSPCPSPLRCLESLNVWQSATTLHGPASQQASLCTKGLAETKETIESHGGDAGGKVPPECSKIGRANDPSQDPRLTMLGWWWECSFGDKTTPFRYTSRNPIFPQIFTVWYPFLKVLQLATYRWLRWILQASPSLKSDSPGLPFLSASAQLKNSWQNSHAKQDINSANRVSLVKFSGKNSWFCRLMAIQSAT